MHLTKRFLYIALPNIHSPIFCVIFIFKWGLFFPFPFSRLLDLFEGIFHHFVNTNSLWFFTVKIRGNLSMLMRGELTQLNYPSKIYCMGEFLKKNANKARLLVNFYFHIILWRNIFMINQGLFVIMRWLWEELQF